MDDLGFKGDAMLTVVVIAVLALVVLGLVFAFAAGRTGASSTAIPDRRYRRAVSGLATHSIRPERERLPTSEVPGRARREAGRYGANFVIGGLFCYAILARALVTTPATSDPAIPEMLVGGIIGVLLAWTLPLTPTRSPTRASLPRRSIWSLAVPGQERPDRELLVLHLRNPLVFVLAHVPYFVTLFALYLNRPTSLAVAQPVTGLVWLVIFGGFGALGTFQTGWGVQILQVWRSLRQETPVAV
jgi:hypothetical protein